MKLYLSSYRLGDQAKRLAEMVGHGNTIAIIGNAMDFVDKEIREERLQENFQELRSVGLNPIEVDLRDFFGNPDDLQKRMTEFKAVYVRGGNTFILRRAFSQSGFDKWLMGQKNNKDLVYSGYSAGCCVLSPSMKGLEIVDDPHALASGYKPEVIWEGLGLLDFIFVPHFESDHPESAKVGETIDYYKKNNIPFKALHDGEVIITEIK